MATSPSRSGGRSARIRADVHRAVAQLVTEVDVESLTLPLIANRAGVHPTTLYRRWGSVADLVAAVAASRFTGDLVVPDTGSLRGDLEQWAAEVATDLADPETAALLRAAVGSGAQGGYSCIADRIEQLRAMTDRERGRGAVAVPEVLDVADALLGPLYFRTLFGDGPGDPDRARTLVRRLLPQPS
jgi:AcrR family transcriptional regulator